MILSEIKLCWFGNWKQVPLIGTYPVYFSNPLAPYVRSRWENFNLGIGNFIHTYPLKQMECPLACSLHSMYSTLEISGVNLQKSLYVYSTNLCISSIQFTWNAGWISIAITCSVCCLVVSCEPVFAMTGKEALG